jgi:hypothetical protein
MLCQARARQTEEKHTLTALQTWAFTSEHHFYIRSGKRNVGKPAQNRKTMTKITKAAISPTSSWQSNEALAQRHKTNQELADPKPKMQPAMTY